MYNLFSCLCLLCSIKDALCLQKLFLIVMCGWLVSVSIWLGISFDNCVIKLFCSTFYSICTVMLMGTLLYGVKYTFPEYICTFLVAGGVSSFALLKVRCSSFSHSSPTLVSCYFLFVAEFANLFNSLQLHHMKLLLSKNFDHPMLSISQ
jgi:hypothetical protein